MGSASPSDWILLLAERIALGSLAVVLLLVLQIVVLRALRLRRESRARRATDRWEPVILATLDGTAPSSAPPLPPGDLEAFLHLWNRTRGVLSGPSGERLDALARRAGVVEPVLGMIRGRSPRRRLLGIRTAGTLREVSAWEDLVEVLHDRNAYYSLAAAHALLCIDPDRGLGEVLGPVLYRADWSTPRTAHLFAGLPAPAWSGRLARAALDAPPERRLRALELLRKGDPAAGLPVAREVLAEGGDAASLAACLRILGEARDPADLPLLRSHAAHAESAVRLRAVEALGRNGGAEDEGLLVAALSDPDLPVRWQAARSLSTLPSMDPDRLVALAVEVEDDFAREILLQVLAEGSSL